MRYFGYSLFIKPMFNILLISQTFFWLLRLISGISFIKGASRFTNFKTKTWRIFIIFMLSRRSSSYITDFKTFKILKGPSLTKSNSLLSFMIWINIIFILGVLRRKYTLSFFLKVSPQTLLLSANFFIFLLKKIKSCRSLFYNLWIFSTIITIYSTNSSHFLISVETLALNPLYIKNGVLLVMLCSDILYASILMGNNLT